MSSIKVKFDSRGFEKAVTKAAEDAVKERARDLTRDYARMASRLRGMPLAEVKAELTRYHQREGGELTEPDLTRYAEQLQAGETIVFRYGGIKR